MIVTELDELDANAEQFDLAVVGLGYERRGTFCISKLAVRAKKGVALTFGYAEVLSFEDNLDFFKARNFEIIQGNSVSGKAALASIIRECSRTTERPVRIFVDISVMSREMMANVLLALWNSAQNQKLDIFCAYAPSEYLEPPEPAPLRRSEPVSPEFAGWSARPDLPLNSIIGLGFEDGLGIGALQYLEPAKVWAFFPIGEDARFLEVVGRINQVIFDHFAVVKLEYEVSDPHRLRRRIAELTRNVLPHSRLVVVPFGPKIFGWVSMLVALELDMKDLSVWRFSSQEATRPLDRAAAGSVVQFNFQLAGS